MLTVQALREMRRARRTRRLGDLEWFDIAYRVYLAAFFGGTGVIVVSDLVGDIAVTGPRLVELADAAPGALGIIAMATIALGLRSGADGGPIAVEAADVRHVLLAPIPRRRVLVRPAVQRGRSLAFGGAVFGAIAGQLAAQRLPGSPGAWAFGGALAGAALGITFVAVAVISHALGTPRAVGTVLGAALIATQIAAAVTGVRGPGDPVGHVAILGWERDGAGEPMQVAIALTVPLLLATLAAAVVGRLRVEPLVRRGALVSQLRFAVTVQDLRTVIVLRRQLRSEAPRRRPWIRLRRGRAPRATLMATGGRRGLQGALRTPGARIGRMTVLAVAAGVSAHLVLDGTTPMLVVAGIAAFLLGLDSLEPLSQEVDHPSLTDSMPHERGRILLSLVSVPAVTIVPFALIAAAVVSVADPARTVAALVVAVPLGWVGLAGAAVAVVRDSSPVAQTQPTMMPPEFAGFSTAVRTALPVTVSLLAAVPIVALRAAPGADTVVRTLVGAALVLSGTAWWIVRRDAWAQRWRGVMDAATPSRTTTETTAAAGEPSGTASPDGENAPNSPSRPPDPPTPETGRTT